MGKRLAALLFMLVSYGCAGTASRITPFDTVNVNVNAPPVARHARSFQVDAFARDGQHLVQTGSLNCTLKKVAHSPVQLTGCTVIAAIPSGTYAQVDVNLYAGKKGTGCIVAWGFNYQVAVKKGSDYGITLQIPTKPCSGA